MQGIESIRCQSCGCDYFKAKGKNVRFFWYIVGAVVGVLLALFMLGSALGCELCFECAEACDMTELAYCGRDCDQETDGCVANSCKGTQCGDKQEVGRCDEKWDCEHCSGYIVYKVTIVLDENNEKVYEYDQREYKIDEISYFPPEYVPGKGSDYYQFMGYYNKSGKTMYVDAEGNVVRKLKGSTTLYAKYEEKGLGQEYTLVFSTEKETGGNWFETPANIPVIVGDKVYGMPEAPDIDGYTFLGWYNDHGDRVVGPNDDMWTFHLYLMNHSPENENTQVQLHAKYDLNKYTVTFNYDDGSKEYREVYHDTNLNDFIHEMDRSNGELNYKFFGWSTDPNAGPEDRMDYNFPITGDIVLYEIRKDYITLTFNVQGNIVLGGNTEYVDTLTYTTYEGQQIVFSNLEYIYQSELIYDPNNEQVGNNVNTVLQSIHAKPGYSFDGWAINSSNGIRTDSVTVSKTNSKTFYAKWKLENYDIVYKNASGRDISVSFGTRIKYTYGESFYLMDGADYFNDPTFLGWYIEGTDVHNYFTYIDSTVYGDLILRPVFSDML